jgi:NADH-quinone oxidoreductase subunit H
VWPGADQNWWPVLWFLGKVFLFIFFFFWLRGSLPRIRYDQLMRLGWKVLIPTALAWTLIVATARVWRRQGGSPGVYVIFGLIIAVLALLLLRWESSAQRAERETELTAEEESEEEAEGPPSPERAPFPTPPLDLPHYHGIGVESSSRPALAGTTRDDAAAKEASSA